MICMFYISPLSEVQVCIIMKHTKVQNPWGIRCHYNNACADIGHTYSVALLSSHCLPKTILAVNDAQVLLNRQGGISTDTDGRCLQAIRQGVPGLQGRK